MKSFVEYNLATLSTGPAPLFALPLKWHMYHQFQRRWKTRNLDTTRKKTSNYWWLKFALIPYKTGIPQNDNLIDTTS